ncbi:MAG: hypothetical protein IPM60_01880 [Rhodospirillales bacterium]|nr:hypothetical protein [Rhodospirillales bacterium]
MIAYRVRLTVQGPILTRSTAIGAYGVDAPVARDTDGRPFIAGSHVKGKLRQALRDLAKADRAARCFAMRSGQAISGTPFKPHLKDWLGGEDHGSGQARARVQFADFRAEEDGVEDAMRTRIKIDAASGTAEDGALQIMETPYAAGAAIVFTGRIVILAPPHEASKIADAIRRGLHWIPQLGGERTIGFGRLLAVEMAEETPVERPWPTPPMPAEDDRLRLVLRFFEPFCIGVAPREDTLYTSDTVVPGGVIKGALAALHNALNSGRPLPEWFDRLRISHLQPVALAPKPAREPFAFADPAALMARLDIRRPRAIPLSVAFGPDERPVDMALVRDPCLIGDGAPAFRPDWKGRHWAQAVELFGIHEPPRRLQLRTEIDDDTRASKTERLFAYETVIPDGHLWVGELDLADVTQDRRGEVVPWLRALTGGTIPGIGKTDALAQVSLGGEGDYVSKAREVEDKALRPLDDGLYVLTLQTPALLCTTDDISAEKNGSAQQRLERAYGHTFDQISGGSLRLYNYFAKQRLAGGPFLLHHYMKNDDYKPFLLTESGSVFVLEVTDKRKRNMVTDLLRDWLRHGLPLPASVKEWHFPDRAGDDDAKLWDRCPYIRQNGYGEVVINDRIHRTHRLPSRHDGEKKAASR